MTATTRYKYESNANNIFYARTDNDDELASIRGNEPQGTPTEEMTFEFSKNAKMVGCKPRHVVLERVISGGSSNNCLENDGKRYKFVIVLTPQHFGQLVLNSTVSVDGQDYKIKRRVTEQMR